MSVEIMENDEQDKEESSYVTRQYNKVSHKGVYDNNPTPNNGDRINKHSYFLRAKTPRFMGSDNEDAEFKKPYSSFCKQFSSSPTRSRGSHYDHESQSPSEEEDLANCLVMLSNKSCTLSSDSQKEESKGKDVLLEKGMFQCKACKKVFNSHQALGGHRASHKKVKGCFASKLDGLNDEDNGDEDDDQEVAPPPESDVARSRKRGKMHECSVCRRVFSSGQALGGHKRCHWLTTSSDNAFIPNFHDFQYDHQSQQLCKKPMFTMTQHDHDRDRGDHHDYQLDLNLNLPPAPQHDHHKINNQNVNDKTMSKYEASTRLCLQEWANQNQQKIDKNAGDEFGMKLKKLSDLSLDGGWLQMGIAPTTEMR